MTVEHLRPLLERPNDAELLCSLAQELAEASTPLWHAPWHNSWLLPWKMQHPRSSTHCRPGLVVSALRTLCRR